MCLKQAEKKAASDRLASVSEPRAFKMEAIGKMPSTQRTGDLLYLRDLTKIYTRRETEDERTGSMDNQPNFVTSPFDAIRHLDGEREFWRARELHKLLGYDRWENFEKVIFRR